MWSLSYPVIRIDFPSPCPSGSEISILFGVTSKTNAVSQSKTIFQNLITSNECLNAQVASLVPRILKSPLPPVLTAVKQ